MLYNHFDTTHTSLYICLGNKYEGIVESGRYQPYLTVLMLNRNHSVNAWFRAIHSLPVALCFWFDSVSARSIWLWWWPWTCGGKDWTSPCCSHYHVGHNTLSFLSVHIQWNILNIELILSFFTETSHQNYSKPCKLIFLAKLLTRYLLWPTEL